MTEHNTSESLLLAVCHPDQCCAGWCVDEIGLHDVDRDTAEVAAERACMWLADRLAAVQAEAKKWERLALGTSMAHDTALARAESAEAECDRLRARLGAVEALADTWSAPESHRHGAWLHERDVSDRIRAALDSPTSHTQQEGEVVCDHPGINHSPWSYCGVCPACGVCKFIGHGPLCIDCYATRARTTEEPS